MACNWFREIFLPAEFRDMQRQFDEGKITENEFYNWIESTKQILHDGDVFGDYCKEHYEEVRQLFMQKGRNKHAAHS